MENAADALTMAAAVLIFIIALASSFTLFGTAKQTADSIIGMRDKQAYLDAPELDGGILYTSSSELQTEGAVTGNSNVAGFTTKGDRIVQIDDVISTIYRYAKEKYGVTIVKKSNGEVIARFDSNTENIMRNYQSITNKTEDSAYDKYVKTLSNNTQNSYCSPQFTDEVLKNLYKIDIPGSSIDVGAPWYGNDEEIQKRINADISGGTYTYNNQKYTGKKLKDTLEYSTKIVEVTNEIDQSKYLNADGGKTDLLQQYEMPTVEVVYIVY